MAIQNRRGQYRHFDPSKMVAGEWAVVQTGDPNASNGEAVYMAFEPGKVKRMATYEDMVDQIVDAAEEATEEAVAQATATATAAATTATNQATAARSYARGDTGTRTGEATDNAKYYSEQAASAASTAAADAAADAVADVQSTLEGLVDDAETAATLSESYAVGGTGTRTGENTDNAKYYNEQSTNAAISAAASVVSAQNAQTAAEAARDRAEAAADTAVAASGVNLYSIAESPDTNGLALYYIEGDE